MSTVILYLRRNFRRSFYSVVTYHKYQTIQVKPVLDKHCSATGIGSKEHLTTAKFKQTLRMWDNSFKYRRRSKNDDETILKDKKFPYNIAKIEFTRNVSAPPWLSCKITWAGISVNCHLRKLSTPFKVPMISDDDERTISQVAHLRSPIRPYRRSP